MGIGTQDLKFNVLARVVGANAIDNLGKGIEGLNRKANFLGSGLKALAALYSVEKVKEFGLGVLETADSLYKLSQKTGVSVTDLAKLKGVAEISGVQFDQLGIALRKLSVNLVEANNGNQEFAGTFKKLHIDIHKTGGGLKDAGTIVKELADKFSKLKDGPEKAAIAVKLFGRSGSDIIPLLNRGAGAIEEFSTSMDQDFGARAEAFNESIILIGKNLKSGGIAGMKEILPTLQELANSFKVLTKTKTDTLGFFDVLGESARLMSQAIVVGFFAVTDVIDRTVTTFREAKLELKGLAGIASAADEEKYGKLKRDFANRVAARDAAEKKFLHDTTKNSLLFGVGSNEDILSRQREDTAPKVKPPGTSADASALGENARIIKEFEHKLAKMRAEADSYGQTNAQREQAILLAELESKGLAKTSTAYEKLSQEIITTTEARESAKEKNQAREFQNTQQRQIELDKLSLLQIDMMTVEYQKLTEARKIDNAALEATKNFTVEGTVAYFEATEAIKEQRLALLDLEQQQKETWSTGAKQALRDYAENAKDVASQVKHLFQTAFQDMEDALVNFVKGGKLDFSKFADDIITEIIRIQIRAAIAQAAIGVGGLFSGLFSSGGGASSNMAGGAGDAGFNVDPVSYAANGGIMTGRGMAKLNTYAKGGIAKSPQIAVFGEGRNAEAYVPLPDGRTIPVTMKGGQGGGDTSVTVHVNVDKGTESTKSDSDTGSQLGKLVAHAIKVQILQEKRPGGLLA